MSNQTFNKMNIKLLAQICKTPGAPGFEEKVKYKWKAYLKAGEKTNEDRELKQGNSEDSDGFGNR